MRRRRLLVLAGLVPGVGVTSGDPVLTPAEPLALADEKPNQAKREGRNRVAS
jgi:hypothetical protein